MSNDTSPSAQDALNDLFKQYNEKLSDVMPQAVGYNIALFSGISVSGRLSRGYRPLMLLCPAASHHHHLQHPPSKE